MLTKQLYRVHSGAGMHPAITVIGQVGALLARVVAWVVAGFTRGASVFNVACIRGTTGLARGIVKPPQRTAAEMPLTDLVDQAHRDLVNAQRFFAEASDPDLVDQAIYLLNAAEKRYAYLLKQARRVRTRREIPAGML